MAKIEAKFGLLALYEAGCKSVHKLRKISGLPRSTIYRLIARFQAAGSFQRKPGSGRPRKLEANDRRRLAQLASVHPNWSAKQLGDRAAALASARVSEWTVRRSLKESGILKKVPTKIPLMTEEHKRKRREWCQKNRHTDFSNCMFTDESKFQFFRITRKRWCRNGTSEKMCSKFSPSVMVWGGIGKLGLTPLLEITGRITSEKYCELLQEGLLESNIGQCGIPFVMQQDNARVHTSAYTKTWLRQNRVTVMDFPAASPDLNPIENVWQVVKDRVEKLEPKDMGEWKRVIHETWTELSEELIDNLVNSMP